MFIINQSFSYKVDDVIMIQIVLFHLFDENSHVTPNFKVWTPLSSDFIQIIVVETCVKHFSIMPTNFESSFPDKFLVHLLSTVQLQIRFKKFFSSNWPT